MANIYIETFLMIENEAYKKLILAYFKQYLLNLDMIMKTTHVRYKKYIYIFQNCKYQSFKISHLIVKFTSNF